MLSILDAMAGDKKPRPDNWGEFYAYQENDGRINIRILASNDQGCNDVWDYMSIMYVTDDGRERRLLRFDNSYFHGSAVLKDPNDNIYHYYKGENGNQITLTEHKDSDGGDFYMEFRWHNPPKNLRKKNNFYIKGLWRACTDDWIGDWRYSTASNSPWIRTCVLLDGGLTTKYDKTKKKDIQRYWAPRVFNDTRNDRVGIKRYPFYWQQDIFGPVNFDGEWNAKNNWENNAGKKIVPKSYAYSSFVESWTHYFIGYQFFHPTDDSRYQSDRHENDWEDVYICIKKGPENGGFGKFEAMVTQAHGNYKKYDSDEVELALGHHPQIYITSNGFGFGGWATDHGHSIHAYNGTYTKNFSDFGGGDGVIFSISDEADHIKNNPERRGEPIRHSIHAYYDILDIDEIWSLRETKKHDPFMKYKYFGGEGDDGKDEGAHAPWDTQSFYHPAKCFNSEFGVNSSVVYDFNPYKEANSRDPEGPEQSPSYRGGLPYGFLEKTIQNGNSVVYYTHGDLTISGSDEITNGQLNNFHYVYQRSVNSSTKSELIVKVDRIRQNISEYTKVGVRASSGTSLNDPYVAIYQEPNGDVFFEYKTVANGGSVVRSISNNNRKHKYFRINRSGRSWYAYYSLDKINWSYAGSAKIESDYMHVGLFVDHNSSYRKASVTFVDIAYRINSNYVPPAESNDEEEDDESDDIIDDNDLPDWGDGPKLPSDLFDMQSAIKIYPNPSDGSSLRLEVTKSNEPNDITISIFSLRGEVMHIEEHEDVFGSKTFELTDLDLKSGIYLVETVIGESKSVKKLVVK